MIIDIYLYLSISFQFRQWDFTSFLYGLERDDFIFLKILESCNLKRSSRGLEEESVQLGINVDFFFKILNLLPTETPGSD